MSLDPNLKIRIIIGVDFCNNIPDTLSLFFGSLNLSENCRNVIFFAGSERLLSDAACHTKHAASAQTGFLFDNVKNIYKKLQQSFV